MKSKGNHSSALHEEHRSLSHTALSVHRATGTAQAAVPCFHLEQFLMAQQIEVSKWPEELQHFTLPHTKKTGLYVRQAAKLRREHHTCTSLGDRQQFARKRLKSLGSTHGEASWLAKGLLQPTAEKQHCACIAMSLSGAEQMLCRRPR